MPDADLKPHRPEPAEISDAATARYFVVLSAIAVIFLWVLPLRSSFWLDETGTFWVIHDGIAHLIARSASWTGTSPLYPFTAWLALALGGPREWVIRLPSLLASLLAALLFYRLAVRLFDVPTAQLAVLAFVSSEPIAFAAADARPYALGLCFVIASALMLVNWLDTGAKRYAAVYALCFALAIYTHYFFGPPCAVLGIYALFRTVRERRVKLGGLLLAWMGVAILLLPLLSQILHLFQNRAGLSFSETPSYPDLFASLAPPVLWGSVAAGCFLAWRFSFPSRLRSTASRTSLQVAIAWAVTPPLFLFLISILTPIKIFVPRYYISAIPGLCLFVAWTVRSIWAAPGRRIVATAVMLGAIVSFGSLRHGYEDWSGAMRKVRSVIGDENVPVLAASGFFEASDPAAFDDPKLREVLFAPLEMYPPGGRLVPLPYRLDEKTEPYLDRAVAGIQDERRFVLIVRLQGIFYEAWLRGRLASQGFRSESLGNFGTVGAFLFTRTAPTHFQH